MSSDILGNSWHISTQGLEIITENNTIKDRAKILQNALDTDLKEIGSPFLSKELSKNNLSNTVLQIQKIRNISAPKANENSQAAPRMLKLVLTDGDSYVQAIETSFIQFISPDKTAPGSKLLIISADIVSGYLLLNPKNCKVLGGQVPHLYEKWELAKSVQHHNRQNSSCDGPPAWVNFGCKIASTTSNTQDKQFKSLDNNKNKETNKDKDEFELQRQGAIAEATSGGAVKKVFGGGTKQQIQYNQTNNNYTKRQPSSAEHQQQQQTKDFNRKPKGKQLTKDVKEVEEKPQKPPERVSLFDFLEDKLPAASEVTTSNNSYRNPPTNSTGPASTTITTYNKSYNQHYQQQQQHQQSRYRNNEQQNSYENNYNRSNEQYRQNQRYDNSYKRNNNKKYDQQQQRYDNKNTNNDNRSYQNTQKVVENLGTNMEKMTINNSQFASRSLKQHLNLGSKPQQPPPQQSEKQNTNVAQQSSTWKVGDVCLAKYWEDGKHYEANIIGITEKTYVVNFKGYGNTEEILKNDCLPFKQNDNHWKGGNGGSREFRRSNNSYRRN